MSAQIHEITYATFNFTNVLVNVDVNNNNMLK